MVSERKPLMTNTEEMRSTMDRIGPAYDEQITPLSMRFGEEAVRLAGIGRGMRVLDVAAGGGAFSIPAARTEAHVLATDISQVLLDRLAERARNEHVGDRVETRVMDGHQLEVGDDSFDVAASQFGIMLFPDRPRALKQLARVTKPGGKGVIVAFGPPPRVELFFLFIRAMQSAVQGFTPPAEFPIFSMQDPRKLADDLKTAGYSDVRVETVDGEMPVASGEALWNLLTSVAPPVIRLVGGLSDEQQTAVRRALDQMVAERRTDNGPAMLNMQANVAIAAK